VSGASRPLKVLVAGGGIGGLAAAIALLQRGFDVEVYEQAGELREIGAGIQISPNGNRALDALGAFEPLRELSVATTGKEIRLWNTGQTWKLFDLGPEAIRKYGYPYITVFRPDLLRVLGDRVRALKPGAVRLGARAVDASQTADGVTLQLGDGSSIHGDVLVGADGVHTRTREALFGTDPVNFSGMVAWRALIPMDALPPHLARPVALNWVGPGGHVVHYPVQGGQLMNFVGTLEGQPWSGPPWNAPSSRAECAAAFSGWHEDVLTMIDRAPSLTQWAMCTRPFLDTWSRGRATLLGDACHATLPFLAQGAVSSIEDGIVLARCLEQGIADVPAALRRYDEVRRPHAYRMVRGSFENTRRFHNPALATPETAQAFVSREWQSQAISERYDWLFTYQADTVPI
jgi:salicylate hydroxylase